MALGIGVPKRGVGSRSRRVAPRRIAPVPVRATRVSAAPSPVARATHITFYDPSRVIKREHLKVVQDMRASENADERGEVQTGDNGITGPESEVEESTGFNSEDKKMSQAQSRVQFADWLKENHPAIFSRAIKIAANSEATLQSLGEEPTKSFWEKFTEAAAGLGTTYLTLENQRKAMKINLARAQQGLPPIDAATSAPVIKTQVDISPELTSRLVSTAGEGFNKMLLLGAAAVAAFFIFK